MPQVDVTRLTETEYQLEKYLKHTAPTSAYLFNTVFPSPGSATYADYVIAAVNSGHVEIDAKERINIIYVASSTTGMALSAGRFIGPTDAVKLVLPHDEERLHAFPILVEDIEPLPCDRCGKLVP
jgi:hypothetical protein